MATILQSDPLYRHLQTVKPTVHSEVFVQGTEAFELSMSSMEAASRGQIIDPTLYSREELLQMLEKYQGNVADSRTSGSSGTITPVTGARRPVSTSSSTFWPFSSMKQLAKKRTGGARDHLELKEAKYDPASGMRSGRSLANTRISPSTQPAESTSLPAKSVLLMVNDQGIPSIQVASVTRNPSDGASGNISLVTTPRPSLSEVHGSLMQSVADATDDELAQLRMQAPVIKAALELNESRNRIMQMDKAETIEWLIEVTGRKTQECGFYQLSTWWFCRSAQKDAPYPYLVLAYFNLS
jgi:hypothetical protein